MILVNNFQVQGSYRMKSIPYFLILRRTGKGITQDGNSEKRIEIISYADPKRTQNERKKRTTREACFSTLSESLLDCSGDSKLGLSRLDMWITPGLNCENAVIQCSGCMTLNSLLKKRIPNPAACLNIGLDQFV